MKIYFKLTFYFIGRFTLQEVKDKIKYLVTRQTSNKDMFCMAISTHGDNGLLKFSDDDISAVSFSELSIGYSILMQILEIFKPIGLYLKFNYRGPYNFWKFFFENALFVAYRGHPVLESKL